MPQRLSGASCRRFRKLLYQQRIRQGRRAKNIERECRLRRFRGVALQYQSYLMDDLFVIDQHRASPPGN